jgi:hypothetical protein
MSCVAIIPFDSNSASFTDDMLFLGKNLSKRIPIVSIIDTMRDVFYFVVKPSECCSITFTENPGDSSPCTTIIGFDDPQFVFLILQNATFRQTLFP